MFIKELKKEGLYDDSVIAIYGDHFGLSLSDETNVALMSEYLGREYLFSDIANVPLIIHIPGAENHLATASAEGETAVMELPKTVSVAGGQTDFLPTMAYLMGFEELDTIYMGRNLLEKDQEGYVIQYRYAQPGTFITNEYCFNASSDGLFQNGKAYQLKSGERLKPTKEMKELFQRSIGLSQLVHETLEMDAFRELYYSDGQLDRVETEIIKWKPAKPVTPPQNEVVVEPVVPIGPEEITTPGAIELPDTELNVTLGQEDTETTKESENDGGNVSNSVI